jgi:cobalt-precorrin 5A hydrolase
VVVGEAVIVAGIGSRKGVSAAEVVAAVDVALKEHGLERDALTKLATTEFKKEEAGIFEAGEMMGLEVVLVSRAEGPLTRPPLRSATLSPFGRGGPQTLRQPSRTGTRQPLLPNGEKERPDEGAAHPSLRRATRYSPEGGQERSLSLKVAGVESVSETAALAAAGEGAWLAGPRIAVGRVTCAIAHGGDL